MRTNPSWPRLAELPLVVEGYELEPLTAELAGGMVRTTIQVRLHGAGHDGLGEDISAMPDDPDAARHGAGRRCRSRASGRWRASATTSRRSSSGRSRRSGTSRPLPQLGLRVGGARPRAAPGRPRRCTRCSEREPRPLRFVNSLGLGDPPSTDTIHRRLARYPDVRFKLDAAAAWTLAICEDLAATGAVDVVDFKGQYGMEVEDAAGARAPCTSACSRRSPTRSSRTRTTCPRSPRPLAPHADRVSYDALIHSVDDLATTPVNPIRTVNIKPCRTGSLRALLALYAHCEADGLRCTAAGWASSASARGQIQLLASLFHPDAPNDVAPSALQPAPTRPRACRRARCRRSRSRRASAARPSR